MHRGAEKLFEVRDYRQALVLANRHDWLSSFANELGIVLAVERMLGMEVPERAVWARTLLAELNRVLSHLAFLGGPVAWQARERVQTVLEEFSGGRLHYMANQVGGLKVDLPEGWPERVRTAVAAVRPTWSPSPRRRWRTTDFRARTRGVGRLDPSLVPAYGLSGPVARASGDRPRPATRRAVPGVRRTRGQRRTPGRDARREGDALAPLRGARRAVRRCPSTVADACLDVLAGLPDGPVNLRLPKVLRVPEGETYTWTENPLGINGYYLVSRGERTPWRLKLRSASFNNVQVLEAMLPGQRLGDLATILQSMVYVLGDVDK